MKRCPTCQQMFPDNAPDLCPYDGTQLMGEAQQQYYAGGQPPYGTPPDPSQWQPPPPPGGYYQQPGQYPPPYGGPYAPSGGSSGLSKAAMLTGIGALGSFIFAVILAMIGASGGYSTLRGMLPIIGIFSLLALLAGLTAIVLGIVTLSMANKNPAVNKVHGILGIVFGAIPIILWFIGIANRGRF